MDARTRLPWATSDALAQHGEAHRAVGQLPRCWISRVSPGSTGFRNFARADVPVRIGKRLGFERAQHLIQQQHAGHDRRAGKVARKRRVSLRER